MQAVESSDSERLNQVTSELRIVRPLSSCIHGVLDGVSTSLCLQSRLQKAEDSLAAAQEAAADCERQVKQFAKRAESERLKSQQLEDSLHQLQSSTQIAEKSSQLEQDKLVQARDRLQSQLVESQRKVGPWVALEMES